MKRLVVMTAMVLVLSASFVLAQPFGPVQGNQPMMGRCFKNIPNLTADQQKQIEQLRLEHQKAMLPLRTKLREAQLEMRSLQLKEADQKAIDKQIEKIGQIKIEIAKKKNAHRNEIRNLLTDEQKKFFDSRKGHWNRMGPHGRGKPGCGANYMGPRQQRPPRW